MNAREKLVELLNEVQETGVNEIPAGFGYTSEYVNNKTVASHLIANGVTVQEWISVKDRLPEQGEEAICINADGNMMIGKYTKWGWMFPCYFEDLTHWMPLPPAPKGE